MRILAGLKGLRQYRAFQTVFRAVINGVVRIGSFCLVFFLFITVFAILHAAVWGLWGHEHASLMTLTTLGRR